MGKGLKNVLGLLLLVMKHDGHKQLGEERVHFTPASASQSISEGSQGGSSRQALEV